VNVQIEHVPTSTTHFGFFFAGSFPRSGQPGPSALQQSGKALLNQYAVGAVRLVTGADPRNGGLVSLDLTTLNEGQSNYQRISYAAGRHGARLKAISHAMWYPRRLIQSRMLNNLAKTRSGLQVLRVENRFRFFGRLFFWDYCTRVGILVV